MSEFTHSDSHDMIQQARNILNLVGDVFPEDLDFITGMDVEDAASFLYGQLIEGGYDPDETLVSYGITEVRDEV